MDGALRAHGDEPVFSGAAAAPEDIPSHTAAMDLYTILAPANGLRPNIDSPRVMDEKKA